MILCKIIIFIKKMQDRTKTNFCQFFQKIHMSSRASSLFKKIVSFYGLMIIFLRYVKSNKKTYPKNNLSQKMQKQVLNT